MTRLQDLTRFARLVLGAWLLALGAAIAAPAVNGSSLQMVCAGGVMKLQAQDQEGATPTAAGLGCPLCASVAGPLPSAAPVLPSVRAVAAVAVGSPGRWVADAARAPLPARGPPALRHA